MSKRQRDEKRTRLFVVRLWPESFDYGRRSWRGEVVNTATDGRRYFARWEELLAFLCNAIDVPWKAEVSREITTEIEGQEIDDGRSERRE